MQNFDKKGNLFFAKYNFFLHFLANGNRFFSPSCKIEKINTLGEMWKLTAKKNVFFLEKYIRVQSCKDCHSVYCSSKEEEE